MLKKIFYVYMGLCFIWNITLFIIPNKETFFNYAYNGIYGLIFVFAFINQLNATKIYEQKLKLPIIMLGVGYLSYGIAMLIWMTYNIVLKLEIPYPGLPDIFFVLYYLLITVGLITLVVRSDNKYTLKNIIESTIIFITFTYIIHDFLEKTGVFLNTDYYTKILNYIYPIFDSFILSLTFASLRANISGKLSNIIVLISLGFIFISFADILFTYQVQFDRYWNGNLVDICFAIGGLCLALSSFTLVDQKRIERSYTKALER